MPFVSTPKLNQLIQEANNQKADILTLKIKEQHLEIKSLKLELKNAKELVRWEKRYIKDIKDENKQLIDWKKRAKKHIKHINKHRKV